MNSNDFSGYRELIKRVKSLCKNFHLQEFEKDWGMSSVKLTLISKALVNKILTRVEKHKPHKRHC